MARTPEEIAALFQTTSGTPLNGSAEDGVITEEEKIWRTGKLRDVLITAQQAWLTGSEDLDLIAEKIADGARDPSWRLPIGDSGLLSLFLTIIPSVEGLRQPLKIHALRIIGNSSADCDENRARVVESGQLTGTVMNLLSDDTLLAFVIPVLYNVCVDYPPAQKQVCEAALSSKLVDILSSERLMRCEAFLNLIIRILELLVDQDAEPRVANPFSPSLLLNLALSNPRLFDLEDYTSLLTVALAYLTYEQLQKQFLESRSFELLQQAFEDSYARFDISSAAANDPETIDQLRQCWQAFESIFADVSAQPAFGQIYPLGSPAVARLVTWLAPQNSTHPHMQTAACLSLGNLSRSDESSMALVQSVYQHLSTILSNALPPAPGSTPATTSTPGSTTPVGGPSAQLLHAALSFLKNLAIPAANKPLLGSLLATTLPRLWTTTSTQPQVQFAAVSLTRLLLVNCPANVRRICSPLSPDPASPAHDRSNLHVLMDLSKRADAEPTKMEIARAICSVCRVLHSTPVLTVLPEDWAPPPTDQKDVGDAEHSTTTSSSSSRRGRFYEAHSDMAKSLSELIAQRLFPTVRSEAFFVFALMSRSLDGARMVLRALQPFEACRALVEAVTGRDMFDGTRLAGVEGEGEAEFAAALTTTATTAKDSTGGEGDNSNKAAAAAAAAENDLLTELGLQGLQPQQVDPKGGPGGGSLNTGMGAKVDRENGLVLVAEILRNFPDYMPPFRRNLFEEMLAKGGELVLHERKQDIDHGGSGSS
ncbi:hypothetical protein QBC46DRAFT_425822 [Diplogelasinospora grovesii]|uniref:Uncharacterized protein n=1 Tax=Diplogelasinospora grovesii TaxID=303347 RepID=A0AAN6NDA9_9PEZI|nr:hypothetical protein QBC46DRAFT_425822 [Diplogelasinospora grovesii]